MISANNRLRAKVLTSPTFTLAEDEHHELMKQVELKVIEHTVGRVAETSKLKGIYWPGMDLFDSATAEMKRNRNQKKDGSVLQKMIQGSTEVEPNEWIFDSDGDIYKIRSLYAPSTDSSPVS